MTGILAYGSLINPEAFAAETSGFSRAVPVRVRGYRRFFSQKLLRYSGEEKPVGVLNVERSAQHWINAVCLLADNDDDVALEAGEGDYDKAYVCSRDIACYPGHALPADLVPFIYVGKAERHDGGIPLDGEDLGRCIDGAANWGDTFFLEFVETTYLVSGTPLQEYLSVTTR